MESPIASFNVFPDYENGFSFVWEIAPDFSEPFPWKFIVQAAPSPTGEWKPISDELENCFLWKMTKGLRINKSDVLYFRVVMRAGGKTFFSSVITPYGDLNRKEFLIGKDIMRREILHCRELAGVVGKLYLVSNFGPRCPYCLDPITGQIRDSHCKKCFGTGRFPAYHGPYMEWMLFSGDTNHVKEEGDVGTIEEKAFSVRMIGNPVAKKNDVIVDVRTNKRYYVHKVDIVSEIRRVPIVQQLTVKEAPITDKIYSLD